MVTKEQVEKYIVHRCVNAYLACEYINESVALKSIHCRISFQLGKVWEYKQLIIPKKMALETMKQGVDIAVNALIEQRQNIINKYNSDLVRAEIL